MVVSGDRSVAIVGGGLAGLSAGCALAEAGFYVTLLERRPFVGGRASSYEHPGTGEVVDNCQHVLLGCCTNLLDLYRRFGGTEKIRWYDQLTFIEPGGRQSKISLSFLPAPFHALPSFLTASSLQMADKFAIARAMLALMKGLPQDSGEDFLHWLRRKGQTERAIEHFWKVVLVSALNEDLDRVSVRYAAQVFRESFLKSALAGRMGIPTVPLTQLYSSAVDYIRSRGGVVKLRASVESIAPDETGVCIKLANETLRSSVALLAVPYFALAKLLPQEETSASLRQDLEQFQSSPITGIHLWFDRQITDLEHAVLLDRTIQWLFHKSLLLDSRRSAAAESASGSYVELVVSSSKDLVEKSRGEIIELALKELAEFFPTVKNARLVKATVIKEYHATYSALPQSDLYRPKASTAWPRVFLAGDWTATGWPATMEGAVRSGYIAAEEITRAVGQPQRFLLPDLPAAGFMRLFD